ncbi:survival protein sure-like phosphatase/nucleotidase [Xylaria bambusicola]|uniref:survival protein sure-like phosphatase/nucleotidase n=1 Tax=Xylaria bambusicola TaxID=326684 RepID=UPI0020087517|nr:survival protein sure-like phosphatase/nucleotidase [Xylaria bambusicola]KAI0514932.1 survival protein sure-like phosphatase/nucleotidase [Xylaria bambusicola]
MHILVTNDDGPPGPASPYVHSLVRALQKAGHIVSVCLPDTQRSWIGKAHMIGQTVKPVYYRPPITYNTLDDAMPQGTTHRFPSRGRDAVEEWVLVDGTPASCAQIGLHHVFRERGPIDIVVSGPNFGRNSTALFALSSGTLGAAMEAAVCRRRAIALSYAHFKDRQDPKDPAIIEQATRHSVRVIEALASQWPTDESVDLYTVNVALLPGLENRRTIFTPMLQNYWGDGGTCFTEVEGSVGDEDEEEERIRGTEGSSKVNGAKAEGDEEDDENKGLIHRHFKWKPRFEDVYQSVEEAPPGNDGWAVKEGHTSVTPMKANFWHAASHLHGKELDLQYHKSIEEKLSPSDVTSESTLVLRPKDQFHALVAYEDAYVQPLIISALETLFPPETFTVLAKAADAVKDEAISLAKILPHPSSNVLQITPYEAIDWDFVAAHSNTCLVNSYMLRKALIRKHYLAATVEQWVAKRPQSILKDHVKRSEAFEVDYAEFLDDALVEAFDLRASLERNENLLNKDEREAKEAGKGGIEWWILKPGMSDRGQGIRLFCTMAQLQDIFDGWEAERPDSDDEGEDADDEDGGDYIATSQLRHFVAQPYIDPPLLLPGDDRKFHIRTYVACVGGLDVYVYRHMLALFAAKPYVPPRYSPPQQDQGHEESSLSGGNIDLEAHLTNTCLQRSVAENTVQLFWDLPLSDLPSSSSVGEEEGGSKGRDAKTHIFEQICDLTGEVFEAAARTMQMHFRPLENAFEIFGLDFLVDAAGDVYLLEVNAFPDFRQTGDELRDVVAGLWKEVLGRAVGGFFGGRGGSGRDGEAGDLVLVRQVDLGW